MKSNLLLLIAFFTLLYACSKPESFKQPTNLRCEYQVNPLGIDDLQPRLSWFVNDTNRGAIQTAYQVLVASDDKLLKKDHGNVWDTKKVESSQSVLVPYPGSGLESGKRYYWKVRTWDNEGNPSDWSEPAWWEMGLLNKTDWKAKWIGMDIIVEKSALEKNGNWVGYPENEQLTKTVFFRKTFNIPEGKTPRKAFLSVNGKNNGLVSINGKKIRDGEYPDKISPFDVTDKLASGLNVLAISISNTKNEPVELIFSLDIIYSDGADEWINSDSNCKVSVNKFLGWDQPGYDDSGWEKTGIIRPFGLEDMKWLDSAPAPRSTMIRKKFTAVKNVKKARAYVTGLGNYKLFMNGKIVGDDLLTPGWTDYSKRVQYQVYDVTEMIEKGPNAVGMILGNMWWSSGLGWKGGARYSQGPLRGLCQLEIEYTNGTRETILTDGSWKAHLSPVVENSIYHGETYDARLKINGWCKAGLDDSGWPDAVTFNEQDTITLSAQYGPPIQITSEIKPVSINEVGQGKYVFDMGINMVGFALLMVEGTAGTEIVLRFAELLHEDGTVAQENLRSAKATDRYILKGDGVEIWQPYFTYHGFRYVQVEGFPGVPTADNLTGLRFHSNAPVTGQFECSNEIINKIWHNILNGQRGNMHSVPTDCPQRDERLGWTGDAQMFAPTASYNMNMARFFGKWTRDMTDSQSKEGWISDVNPAIVVEGPGKPAWADAITVVPWTVYKFFGDEKILKNNYEGMKAWVEYMRRESKDNLYIFDQNGWGGYGDWISVVKSPSQPISAAYYYYSTSLLAKAAEVLGFQEDAEEYNKLSNTILKSFNDRYFNPKTANYPEGTQTANLLPLAFGIVPGEYRQKVADNIATNVIERDKHPSTGFLGTGYLLPMLSDYGYHELAYEVATQKTYPSWGYMAEKGATSIWELWNSDKERPDQMNSRNHFALGSVGEWFYEYLAGIKTDINYPGFKQSIIAPLPVGDLDWAECRLQTEYGLLGCLWHKRDGGLDMKVCVPPNTTATIKIPVKGIESPEIMENQQVIFTGGSPGNMTPGLEFVGATSEAIMLKAGSGKFMFNVR